MAESHFFRINVTGTPIVLAIDATGWTEDEPRLIGEVVEADDGSPRSSVSGIKRRWSGTTISLSRADWVTVTTAIDLAAVLACDGRMFENGGATVNCILLRGASPYRKQSATNHKRRIALRVMQA